MYTIIKASDIDTPRNAWELMEFSNSVEGILQTWADLIDYLKVCYKDCLIQPWEDGHSPYEVTIGYDHRLTLSAEVYITRKNIAYRLITE